MQFRDIQGQDAAIESLRSAIDGGRLPHALLIYGQEGSSGLALAHAAAQYIMCKHKHDGEPCGQCPECIQAAKCAHPDLHWVYPIINKGGSGKEASVSEDFIAYWREAYLTDPDLSLPQWTRAIVSDENKQAKIYVSEAGAIIKTLSTKPYESDYRIMIIWLPEKISEDAANKLLKIIEEPYDKTHFLLVSNDPDHIIGTIQSRVQRLHLAPPSHEKIIEMREASANDEETQLFFDLFTQMMRLSYARKLFDMKAWSVQMSELGRERQKNFLQYAQMLIRENYIMNLREPELNYMNQQESAFSSKFCRFVNAKNVEGIMNELALAETDIAQNVSAKMVFFDLSLKLIMLLKAGN